VTPNPKEREVAESGKALHRLMKAVLDHPEMTPGDQKICREVMRVSPQLIFASGLFRVEAGRNGLGGRPGHLD